MTPPEFIEWLQQQIEHAEGMRNYHPNTEKENKFWDGKITAFKEVLDKTMDNDTKD